MATMMLTLLPNVLFALAVFAIPHSLHWILKANRVGAVYLEFTGHAAYLNEGLVLLALLGWGAVQVKQSKEQLSLPPWWAVGAWLLLFAHSLLSATWAEAPTLALDISLRWFVAFGFCLFVLNKAEDWQWGFAALVAGMVANACLAYLQFRYQGGEALLLGESTRESLAHSALWIRGQGLAPHPNVLGGYLAAGLPLLLGALIQPSQRGWILSGALALTCLGLLSTFSRTALLGVASGVLFLAMVLWRQRVLPPRVWRWLGIGALLILTIGALFVALNWSYFHTRWLEPLRHWLGLAALDSNAPELWNLSERAWYTQAAYGMIREHPWQGMGAGNFTLVLHQTWSREIWGYVYQPVHNTFLLLASELGYLGAGWWVLLLLVPVVLTLSLPADQTSLPLGICAASLSTLSIISLFDYYLWMLPQGRLLLALLLGRWYALWQARG
jgi:hypothetical protein